MQERAEGRSAICTPWTPLYAPRHHRGSRLRRPPGTPHWHRDPVPFPPVSVQKPFVTNSKFGETGATDIPYSLESKDTKPRQKCPNSDSAEQIRPETVAGDRGRGICKPHPFSAWQPGRFGIRVARWFTHPPAISAISGTDSGELLPGSSNQRTKTKKMAQKPELQWRNPK